MTNAAQTSRWFTTRMLLEGVLLGVAYGVFFRLATSFRWLTGGSFITLDEHVTIGGRYFDVLHGEYRLEVLPNGDTLLHLSSQQRLSTDFNGYAGLWSDAVMRNLQTSILEVIQHRCEHA